MMIKKLYPGGKDKAFALSYDDGVLQDVRFVTLLNRYGLKGTFNLNSGLMRSRFSWTHESGLEVTRLSESAALDLYDGHEIASHTLTHPYMESLSYGEILFQMTTDRRNLQELFGREIHGFAVPFLFYSPEIAACAREAGFEYARISEESCDYSLPEEDFYWRGSKFHWDADLEDFIDGFLETDRELALCQLVGHTYDLDVYHMWDRLETIFRRVAAQADIAPMTNLELVRYAKAIRSAQITETHIHNPSALDLWLRIGERTIHLHPGDSISF